MLNKCEATIAVEWRIVNFSCWMKEAHGRAILCRHESLLTSREIFEFSFYPCGQVGECDRLTVTSSSTRRACAVSFVCPDGSVLCTETDDTSNSDRPAHFAGPRFKEVVSRIEQTEKLFGDHLTLQFRYETPPEQSIHMTTTLDVLDSQLHWRVDRRETPVSVNIHEINHDEKERGILLRHRGDHLLLESKAKAAPLWVIIRLRLFDANQRLVAQEDKRIGFSNCPMHSVNLHLRRASTCHLRLKLLNGGCKSHSSSFAPSCSPLQEPSAPDVDCTLREDLSCLYRSGDLSDLSLRCSNAVFPVHKNILSARSVVFKAMLSSGMKEAASGQVDIEDLDPSALGIFLEYLYTGTLREDLKWKDALSLYGAADKYLVESLRTRCTDFLKDNMSVQCACQVLSLADKHEDRLLTSVARDFIVDNFKEVSLSEEWQDWMKTDPGLLIKTVTHFAANGLIGKIL